MALFVEVVFTDYIGFPPSLLVVTRLTTTRVQCAYPLQEEAFTHSDAHSLIVEKERSSRLSPQGIQTWNIPWGTPAEGDFWRHWRRLLHM